MCVCGGGGQRVRKRAIEIATENARAKDIYIERDRNSRNRLADR